MIKPKKFVKWLDRAVEYVGEGQAYCFNLYNYKRIWSCELVSANSFDENDGDWPGDERKVYLRDNPLEICKAKRSDTSGEEVLEKFEQLLMEAKSHSRAFDDLCKSKPVAYGHVNGDLEIFSGGGRGA
ncbi:MAG: hypothetical protein FWE31_00070 [Firmicutes bacterium]|nr:hypothetical protein [Bacillota bacterium]